MKSALIIKDLDATKELDKKAMSAVRGGLGNQANSTEQSNGMAIFSPVEVGNGSKVYGPATFQVDSNPTQYATNDNYSSNDSGFSMLQRYTAV
jgi:hypothetical protein